MKEFLFRYRKPIIETLAYCLSTIIIASYTFRNIGDALLIGFFSTLLPFLFYKYISGLAKMQKSENRHYLRNISYNYITTKCVFILGRALSKTQKEQDLLNEYLFSDFNTRNVKFCYKNETKFSKNEQHIIWACKNLNDNFLKSGKIEVLDFLIRIATADKFLSIEELTLLRKVCKHLRVNYKTLDAILARHNYANEEDQQRQQEVKRYQTNDYAKYYKILELNNHSSKEEVKTAYRKLAKIYHPDKQTGKSNDKAWAKKRFQEIQEAYDKINEKLN